MINSHDNKIRRLSDRHFKIKRLAIGCDTHKAYYSVDGILLSRNRPLLIYELLQ